MSIMTDSLRPPPTFLSLFEGARAWTEASMLIPGHWLLKDMPRGDGHGVMVIPGFLASDMSTSVLRHYLGRWGYDVAGWELGRNLGIRPRYRTEERLLERLEQRVEQTGGPVSLVGWSLGGLFARELAKKRPDLVRSLITLGSPLGDPRATKIWRLYEWVSDTRIDSPDLVHRIAELRRPIEGLPATAIYSKSDSIVSWRIATEPHGERTESIRVMSSHIGLGINPIVLYVVADRLHHTSNDTWQPFAIDRLRRFFYRQHHKT